PPLRSGRNREVTVNDHRSAGSMDTRAVYTTIDLKLRHARLDVCTGPGVTGFARPHAPAQQLHLVRIFLASHFGQGMDQHRSVGIADAVEEANAAAHWIYSFQSGKAAWASCGGMAVVPVNLPSFIDMSSMDGIRKPIIVDESAVPIPTEQQEAAEPM